jgi:hypothetical protein
MPPRAKKPAHERNNPNHSHSQGLAAPGRRISKHRTSLSDFDSAPSSTESLDTDVANGLQHSVPFPSAIGQGVQPGLEPNEGSCDKSVNETADHIATMGSTQSHQLPCRRRTTSASSANDIEAHGIDSTFSHEHAMPGPSHMNGSANGKPVVQKKSKLASATTILSACPLWDVIAILVILLKLPPAVVSVIHGLFAVMTFVRPSATFSFGNLPSLHELMAVDPAGAPSIQTVLLVDALLMLCFVWLAVPAQNFMLELAQVVIAISLGGAAASQGRATSSLICCLSIITFSHLTNWKTARQFGFNFLSSTLSLNLPSEIPQMDVSSYTNRLHSSPGKARSILGAHILAQGILKGVRRYITSSKTQSDLQSILKKNDGDFTSSSNVSTPRIPSNPPESSSESGLHTTGDGRPPGPPPSNAGKDKLMNIKKKTKKQATQVRVQQPFWAAIASTKVTVKKEYEQSRPNPDAQEAHAVDLSNLGNVDFALSSNRVWVMDIGATDVSLGVSLLHDQGDRDSTDAKAKGWHVKVNGASWHSVKSRMVEKYDVEDDVLELWEARIYGLTPLSSYHCEVLTDSGNDLIYETSLITLSAPSMETVTSIPTSVPALQPSSPVATLRSSIRAIESETEKSKNALRMSRKQHRTTLERLQSQIDREKAKVSNTGGTDERQRQRAKQLDNSITKVKAEHQESQQTLDQLGELPSADRQLYSKAKDEAKTRQKKMDAKNSTFERSKRESDKIVASAKGDIDSLLHKRTRFEARQKEYACKLAEASKKAEQAAQAKSLRITRQLESAAGRRQLLMQWESCDAEVERLIAEDSARHILVQHELKQFEEWVGSYQDSTSNPESPEGPSLALPATVLGPSSAGSNSLPGTRPSSLLVSNTGFSPSFTFPQLSTGLNQSGFRGVKGHRRRASSLEANALSELQHNNGNLSNLHSPYLTTGFTAPPGFGAFSPASSSALLANSTALAPSQAHSMLSAISSPFPIFSTNGSSFALKSTPAPVGAEKMEGRRKGSGGSGHSLRGNAAGSDNGSPRISNGAIGSGLRNGMVSPPSSAIWEADGHM